MPTVLYRNIGLIEIEQSIAPASISPYTEDSAGRSRHGIEPAPAETTTVEADIPALTRELQSEVVSMVVEIDDAQGDTSSRRW